MADEPANAAEEARNVAEAVAFLEGKGIPAPAREFRVRQEFFRHGWDVRIREHAGLWTASVLKAGRPPIVSAGSTEGNAARLTLAAALREDARAETS